MITLNIKKIVLTLGIAAGTFYIPASFAACDGLFCPPGDGPIITCLTGDVQAYNNGLHTECEPKDDGCGIGSYSLEQMTEQQCDFINGTVVNHYM